MAKILPQPFEVSLDVPTSAVTIRCPITPITPHQAMLLVTDILTVLTPIIGAQAIEF